MAGLKPSLWLIAGAALVVGACGSPAIAAPAETSLQEEGRIEALERRVESLEAAVGIDLPPNLRGRIGIDRTWIPAAVDTPSVRAVVRRLGGDLGFFVLSVDGADGESATIEGIDYTIWNGRVEVIGPCNLLRRFLTLLESQPVWPTLVVDDSQPGPYGPYYRPAGMTVAFHIITRASDEPPESREEYDRLIADRGAAATAFSCEPIPTPTSAPAPTETPTPGSSG